jgi:hypothetical protein
MVGGSQPSSVRRHRQFLSGDALFALIDRCLSPTADTATFRASDGECLEKKCCATKLSPSSRRAPPTLPAQPTPETTIPNRPHYSPTALSHSRAMLTSAGNGGHGLILGRWGPSRGMDRTDARWKYDCKRVPIARMGPSGRAQGGELQHRQILRGGRALHAPDPIGPRRRAPRSDGIGRAWVSLLVLSADRRRFAAAFFGICRSSLFSSASASS